MQHFSSGSARITSIGYWLGMLIMLLTVFGIVGLIVLFRLQPIDYRDPGLRRAPDPELAPVDVAAAASMGFGPVVGPFAAPQPEVPPQADAPPQPEAPADDDPSLG